LIGDRYLLPLTVLFLAFAVGVLAYRANRRHGYRPFFIGLIAATLIVMGKYTFDYDLLSYAGTFLLVAVSVWNAWPRKKSG
jgi:lipopolysaccharide export LptBFGC system permease protein LptF